MYGTHMRSWILKSLTCAFVLIRFLYFLLSSNVHVNGFHGTFTTAVFFLLSYTALDYNWKGNSYHSSASVRSDFVVLFHFRMCNVYVNWNRIEMHMNICIKFSASPVQALEFERLLSMLIYSGLSVNSIESNRFIELCILIDVFLFLFLFHLALNA